MHVFLCQIVRLLRFILTFFSSFLMVRADLGYAWGNENRTAAMELPPLLEGRLVRRYKRFLADIVLNDGREITAHVANSGSMKGLNIPGERVWVACKEGGKLGFSWELVEADTGAGKSLVGVNTSNPNKIAYAAVQQNRIPELSGYDTLKREVRYGTNSRIDLFLETVGKPPAFVEVKNVHLWRGQTLAEFPDAVTARGAKHLEELARMVAQGARGVMLYIIQGPATAFALAEDIDPRYAAACRLAREAGVEAYAWSCCVTLESIELEKPVPLQIP